MVPIGKRPLTGSIARIASSTCSVMFTVMLPPLRSAHPFCQR